MLENLHVWLITFGVFVIAIAGMAVGVIISNRRLKGSCGGLAGMKDEFGQTACEMCAVPSDLCSGDPNNPRPGTEDQCKPENCETEECSPAVGGNSTNANG